LARDRSSPFIRIHQPPTGKRQTSFCIPQSAIRNPQSSGWSCGCRQVDAYEDQRAADEGGKRQALAEDDKSQQSGDYRFAQADDAGRAIVARLGELVREALE